MHVNINSVRSICRITGWVQWGNSCSNSQHFVEMQIKKKGGQLPEINEANYEKTVINMAFLSASKMHWQTAVFPWVSCD